MTDRPQYTVTLRRANGRYVKSKTMQSLYAAKLLRRAWEDTYDETYVVEVKLSQLRQ